MTNREHLLRCRGTEFFEPMHLFVDTIDRKWYGDGRCGSADLAACRDAHQRIYKLIKERAIAHSS
jgi:hypothetical protein